MKRFLLISTLFAAFNCFTNPLTAQTYLTAAGIRIDESVGLTFQHYADNKLTIEGILYVPLRNEDFGATLLLERHHKILIRNFNFYYGGGAHYYWKSEPSRDTDPMTKNVYGATGIVGAELSIGRLNFSVDLKPELHFAGDQVRPFEFPGVAVSARYIIEKRKRAVRELWDDRPRRKGRR